MKSLFRNRLGMDSSSGFQSHHALARFGPFACSSNPPKVRYLYSTFCAALHSVFGGSDSLASEVDVIMQQSTRRNNKEKACTPLRTLSQQAIHARVGNNLVFVARGCKLSKRLSVDF